MKFFLKLRQKETPEINEFLKCFFGLFVAKVINKFVLFLCVPQAFKQLVNIVSPQVKNNTTFLSFSFLKIGVNSLSLSCVLPP